MKLRISVSHLIMNFKRSCDADAIGLKFARSLESGLTVKTHRYVMSPDSPAEETKTESNVGDDGSEDVNAFGRRKPRYRDRRYHPRRNDRVADRDDTYRDDPIRSIGLKIEILEFTIEKEEHVVTRFLGVLKPEIADTVSLQPYWTYTDVCRLALKVEKHIKVKIKCWDLKDFKDS
ncbi:hypothetical protein Tco_0635083 [Tanacetum coccineum]